jgi:hypothetical protein
MRHTTKTKKYNEENIGIKINAIYSFLNNMGTSKN